MRHARNADVTRRVFCTSGALLMAGLGGVSTGNFARCAEAAADDGTAAAPQQAAPVSGSIAADEAAPLRIGLVTDLHHADKVAQGTRYYRETLGKFGEARDCFLREKISFAIELGDLVDAAESIDAELATLDAMQQELQKVPCPWHYVLGNHCVHALTKEEFLGHTSRRPSYYSFDHGGTHFILLDACFRADGVAYGRENSQWNDSNIPQSELEWLQRDLARNDLPCLVFVHQRLDRDPPDNHTVKQSPQVREILEQSRQVVAVFQGHSHQNEYAHIGGIHYCTLRAMIEGSGAAENGYSVLDFWPDGTLRLRGNRAQASYDWPA